MDYSEQAAGFEVQRNDIVGRFAVAANNLKAGDLILIESPFAFGPKTDSAPVCLGCYTYIDHTTLCSKCGWPVCSSTCENIPAHRDYECSVFSRAQAKFYKVTDTYAPCLQYECITPLRTYVITVYKPPQVPFDQLRENTVVGDFNINIGEKSNVAKEYKSILREGGYFIMTRVLLASERQPDTWKNYLNCMQSHAEERKALEIWNFNQVNIVNYLRGPCKVDRFSEDLIHQVCGILDVNTFEARSSSGNMIRCIYPKSSIPSHNCVSNVTHSISNNREGDYSDYKIALRASVVINKGEELFISYTYPMWPTVVRRTFIKQSKYFDCNCLRCSDPTELGTHMGTLKCTRCKDGMVLSSEPLDYDSLWKCSNCEYTLSNFAVQTMYKTMQDEIDQVDSMRQDSSALEAREYLLEKYKSILHPRNAFLTCLRISLVQMYGKMQEHDLPNIFHERKIELCQRVLENINIVEPGYTRLRGMILFELHTPIVTLTRNLYKTGKIDKNCLRNRLQEARKLLKEASTILILEPENSSEGILGRIAKNAYDKFEEC